MAFQTFAGDTPAQWLAGKPDAKLGLRIGGEDTVIEVLGSATGDATSAEFEPLSSQIEDLNSDNSGIKWAINQLKQDGLSGLGVGSVGEAYTNKSKKNNPEIQSEVGIGNNDLFFIDFGQATQEVVGTVQLFFDEESVSWTSTPLAERLEYTALASDPQGNVTIDGETYSIIDTPVVVESSGTGRWAGRNNLGQQTIYITANTPFDAMIWAGKDYNPETPQSVKDAAAAGQDVDVSDYIISGLQITVDVPPESTPTCFGGDLDTGWQGVAFSYSILGGTLTPVTPANEEDITAVEDANSDLAALEPYTLPNGVDGLGVGDTDAALAGSGYNNDPTPEDPEIQGQISGNDALYMDFSGTTVPTANSADITVQLFYSEEGSDPVVPERLTVELYNGVTLVRTETIEAFGTGRFSSSNAGEYSFTINSTADFDTVVMAGASYPDNVEIEGDVSDYIVHGICLTDFVGDGVQSLGASAGPDTFSYANIADGGDTIAGFDNTSDTVAISIDGFELSGLGLTPGVALDIDDASISDYFSYDSGVLSFDPSGAAGASGLAGDPNNADVVTIATFTGTPGNPNPVVDNLLFIS